MPAKRKSHNSQLADAIGEALPVIKRKKPKARKIGDGKFEVLVCARHCVIRFFATSAGRAKRKAFQWSKRHK